MNHVMTNSWSLEYALYSRIKYQFYGQSAEGNKQWLQSNRIVTQIKSLHIIGLHHEYYKFKLSNITNHQMSQYA